MNINKKLILSLGIGLMIVLFMIPQNSQADIYRFWDCEHINYKNIEGNKGCITRTIDSGFKHFDFAEKLEEIQKDCQAIENVELQEWCASELERFTQANNSKNVFDNFLRVVLPIILILIILSIAIPKTRRKLQLKYWMAIIGFIVPWLVYGADLYQSLESIMTIGVIIPAIMSLASHVIAIMIPILDMALNSKWFILETSVISIINTIIYFAIFGIKAKSGMVGLRFGLLALITIAAVIFMFIGFAAIG